MSKKKAKNGSVKLFIERREEESRRADKRSMIDINLDSSNDFANAEADVPPPRKKRGRAAEYEKKEEVGSLSDAKMIASDAGLKFVNTVKQTTYFACTKSGCPVRWKAVVTDDLNYQILQTKVDHDHEKIERNDGLSSAIKDIIIERINGNEPVNPEAVLQRCRNLGMRSLPTSLQVKNCVAYLKRQLVPDIAPMRQSVTSCGRNKAGRPRKHAPALTKD
uniref:FLYWCH-type domain-containing protein n=1 Tax=Panagrolaimus davidi TaxID=227884 RepID=A0A914QII4_9BILA